MILRRNIVGVAADAATELRRNAIASTVFPGNRIAFRCIPTSKISLLLNALAHFPKEKKNTQLGLQEDEKLRRYYHMSNRIIILTSERRASVRGSYMETGYKCNAH
jgi:hypothetical protein